MKIGVTDTGIPAGMPSVVAAVEAAGFHTYWATEHHSSSQSGSPLLMAALAAASSESLMVGTAGVLVGYHSPVAILEQLRLLQTFFPGRIRFGIAGAQVPAPLGPALLDGRPALTKDTIRERVVRLVELLRTGEVGGSPVGPPVQVKPEIWLCGTSRESAALAGTLGISYAYHEWIATGSGLADLDVLSVYRDEYARQSVSGGVAQCALALRGMCAGTTEEARALFLATSSRPSFVGSPAQVMDKLHAKRQEYGADELVIELRAPSVADICRGYELLGKEIRASTKPQP